jgi:hypothetical protein
MSDQDLPDTRTWSRCESGGAAVDPFNSTPTTTATTTTTSRLLARGEDIRDYRDREGLTMNSVEEGAAGSGGDGGGQADDEGVELSCRIRRRRMEADECADFDEGYGDSKRKRLGEKHKKKMGGPEETTSSAASRKQNQPKKATNPKPKGKPVTQSKSKPNTEKSTRPKTPGAATAAVIDHSSFKFKDDAAKRSKGGRIRSCEVLIGLCPVGGILFVSVEGGYTYAPKIGTVAAENMLVCSYGSIPVEESASRQNKVVEKRPGN